MSKLKTLPRANQPPEFWHTSLGNEHNDNDNNVYINQLPREHDIYNTEPYSKYSNITQPPSEHSYSAQARNRY